PAQEHVAPFFQEVAQVNGRRRYKPIGLTYDVATIGLALILLLDLSQAPVERGNLGAFDKHKTHAVCLWIQVAIVVQAKVDPVQPEPLKKNTPLIGARTEVEATWLALNCSAGLHGYEITAVLL